MSILSAGTTNSTALNLTADTSGSLILASNNNVTAVTVDANQNATFASSVNAPNTFGFKNRIMNGGMVIDQRNAGASGTAVAPTYTVDRFQVYGTQSSKLTWQQNAGSVTPPTGFSNYLGITSSSAYSVGSGDIFVIQHNIEGFNTSDLAFGTANAKTVTLSFWVYSSLTGTFGGSLRNSAFNRSYPFSYTISSANTWTQISITIAGDTTGTWIGATNGLGIQVNWSLGTGTTYSGTAGSWAASNYLSATGATSVVGTNGATFYITGVQLETGTKATSFDYRPYGTELALCQRYYCKSYQISTVPQTSTTAGVFAVVTVTSPSSGQAGVGGGNKWPVQMRTSPTVTIYSQIGTAGKLSSGGADNGTSVTSEAPSEFGAVGIVSSSGLTNNNWYYGHFVATAEY